MSTPTHSHQRSWYHSTEEGAGSLSDWQRWQDSHMHVIAHPAYATWTLNADTASPNSTSLLETQNNLSTLETALDDGYAAPINNFNGSLDFFGSSEPMLPPTGPLFLPVNQFGEWDTSFSSMTFPSTLHVPPSASRTYGRPTLNHVAMSDYPGVGTVTDSNVYNTGPSASVNEDLLLPYAGCFPRFLSLHESH